MPSSPATRNELPIGTAAASRTPTPRALFDLGLAFNALNQHQKALDSFDLAIKLQPDFFEAYGNRGAMLVALGRHNEAIATLNELMWLRPDLQSPREMLASVKTADTTNEEDKR